MPVPGPGPARIQEARVRSSGWTKAIAIAMGLTFVVAACGDDDDDAATTDTTAAAGGSETTVAGGDEGDGAAEGDFTACQVTDTGGVDDGSFNETAFAGL